MLAVVAPGQGTLTPGFAQAWLSEPAFTAAWDLWSRGSGFDLRAAAGLSGEALTDTAVAQPLIVATGLAAYDLLDADPDVVSGYSVGEVTVLGCAGALTLAEAVAHAVRRGEAMARACQAVPTGMAALVSRTAIDPAELGEGLGVAVVNSAEHVLVGGEKTAVSELLDDPPPRTRATPMAVSGAFHTGFMASAEVEVEAALTHLPPRRASFPVVCNRDGAVVQDGQELLDRLLAQVVGQVRWDLCQLTLRDLGVTGLLELPPAGTLTALARRGLPGVETFALASPHDLDEAARFVSRHTATS